MSGCEHLFCLECLTEFVTSKITEGKVAQICCPEASCMKPLNDLDIKNLNLNQDLLDKYELFSVNNAIANMDDMGWCPIKGCGALANIEKSENSGRCQHCEFYFCLDCKNKFHPFKRCDINRVDLMMQYKTSEEFEQIETDNKKACDALMNLFNKHCVKACPNSKCRARIQKVESGCTHMQCPICFNWFCWVCLNPAKGQKHFKENPNCSIEQGNLQPLEVTPELIQKYMGVDRSPFINTRFCALCPRCNCLNQKTTKNNMLVCEKCGKTFCYICNKPIDNGVQHYEEYKMTCHIESELYND